MGHALVDWIHIGSVVVAAGGVALIRFVLMPATKSLNPDSAKTLMAGVSRRFQGVLWTAITLLALTGIYKVVNGRPLVGTYGAFLLTKIVLAAAVFAIVLGITLPHRFLKGMQQNCARWMIVNLILIAVIIYLGMWVKRI